jgi:carbonic anhydrase
MFCGCASLAAFAALSTAAHAQSAECAVFTPARQKEMSPDEAIARLKAGNERFLAGKSVNCNLMQQVKETARGQAPFATIVGCIDSRVPPELVFDQRIGDVFCARIAGNFVNTDIIGSLEFATKIVGSRAIVVLGHSECGAIKGAVDDVRLGNLTAALSKIRPAVEATRADGDRSAKNAAFVQAVAVTNARLAAGKVLEQSPIMKELVAQKQLRVVPAMHDVATGKVTFLA